MAHLRQFIRHATVQALMRKTAAEERVFDTRAVPWKTVELPAIAVFADNESVDPDSRNTAPRELTRTLDLQIEAALAFTGGKDIDDLLDDLSLEIERVMHADPTLGETAADSLLSSTESGVTAEGARLMGFVRLTYKILYRTYAPEAEDTPLQDFKTADAKVSLGGAQDPADQSEVQATNLDAA